MYATVRKEDPVKHVADSIKSYVAVIPMVIDHFLCCGIHISFSKLSDECIAACYK